MSNTCQFEDSNGRCENSAKRKYCVHHRGAGAARRQASYRARRAEQDSGEVDGAAWYAPECNTREHVRFKDDDRTQPAQSGRTIPRFDVHPKPERRAPVTEVVDYTKGGYAHPGLYEERRPSSAPSSVRRDAVRLAQWEAAERNRANRQDDDQSHWAMFAELGEEEFVREQARIRLAQETTPYQHSAHFEAAWRKPGYEDFMQAESVDGSTIGFTR